MERKLAGRGIGRGGQDERCRGRKTSAKGQQGNRCIGSEGMKWLGAGGTVSGGWLRQGGSNAAGRRKGRVQGVRTQKVPGPMRPDAQVSVETHWTRPFHFQTE